MSDLDPCPAMGVLEGAMGRNTDGTLVRPSHLPDPATGICGHCHSEPLPADPR